MAQIKVEMTADQQKLIREFAKQQRKIDQLEQRYGKLGRAGKRQANETAGAFGKLGKRIDKTIGPGTAQSLKTMATGFAGVGAAVGLVSTALADMKRRQDEAINSAKELFDVRRSLAQIAGSPEDFQKFLKQSQQVAKQSILTEGQASKLIFEARSQGFERDVGFLASIAPVLKTGPSTKVAGKFPGLFQAGAITSRQAINAALVGSQPSDINTAQFAEALPTAAESAGELGTRPAELVAALSTLSPQFATPKTAADRLKGFQATLAQRGFRGKGLLQTVRELQALPQEERADILGESQELNIAFNRLAGSLDEIESRRQAVRAGVAATGTPDAPIRQALRARLSDEQAREQIKLLKAESRLAITEREQLAGRGLGARAAVREIETAALLESNSSFRAGLGKLGGELAIGFGADERGAGVAATIGQGLLKVNPFSPDFGVLAALDNIFTSAAEKQNEAAGELREAAGELRNAAQSQSGGPTGVGPREDR